MNTSHAIVVEKRSDFRWPDPIHRVMTADEFIAERAHARTRARKVINLCRDYDYLGLGYYCSLLAQARGERVTPGIDTIVELQQRQRDLLPRLDHLNRLIGALPHLPPALDSLAIHVFFGQVGDAAFTELAQHCFELLPCPLMELRIERLAEGGGWRIGAVRALDPRAVDPAHDAAFLRALDQFARRAWRPAPVDRAPRMDLAILHDPRDPLGASDAAALRNFVRVAQTMDIDAELIEKKDFSRLTQFDALLIRETTAVNHHTFRFAKRAAAEGMPVIDDPASILRCTNKAFLAELMQIHGVPTPRSWLLSRHNLGALVGELSFPVVLKVPDGSFSRSVKKAQDRSEFEAIAHSMLEESQIILAQEFMYTEFDWRVGLLGGQPLFVARYFMSRGHWQILRYAEDGRCEEGRVEAVAVEHTPPRVLEAAVRAAALVGNGLYGVDLKETADGVFVIEINDNPSIDAGYEDTVLGDELYRRVLAHLLELYEAPPLRGAPG